MIAPSSKPSLVEKLLVPPALVGFCSLLFFVVGAVNARVAASGGHFVPLETRLDASVPFIPQAGHCASGVPGVPLIFGSSARKRFLQLRQSTSGSTKPPT